MTRVPFIALVIALTLAGGLAAMAAAPGRLDVAGAAAGGMAVAGGFAAAALAVLRKMRGAGGEEAARRAVNVYLGLMLARMLGYLAFIGAVVVLKAGDPASFCAGLIAGTVIFQVLEVVYIRKMS